MQARTTSPSVRQQKRTVSAEDCMTTVKASVRNVLDKAKAEGRTALAPDEGRLLCEAYGIPVPKEAIAHSAAEASQVAAEIGFPLVMKIVSANILHKTEAGGVIV